MLYEVGDVLEVKDLEVGDEYELEDANYLLGVEEEMTEIKTITVTEVDEDDGTYLSEEGYWYTEDMIKGRAEKCCMQ